LILGNLKPKRNLSFYSVSLRSEHFERMGET